jgi:hypothetical protein
MVQDPRDDPSPPAACSLLSIFPASPTGPQRIDLRWSAMRLGGNTIMLEFFV